MLSAVLGGQMFPKIPVFHLEETYVLAADKGCVGFAGSLLFSVEFLNHTF